MLNRIRAQLGMRSHPNRALQADWESDGPDAFVFDVVDLLPPSKDAALDPREELELLETLWREKLDLHGGSTY